MLHRLKTSKMIKLISLFVILVILLFSLLLASSKKDNNHNMSHSMKTLSQKINAQDNVLLRKKQLEIMVLEILKNQATLLN